MHNHEEKNELNNFNSKKEDDDELDGNYEEEDEDDDEDDEGISFEKYVELRTKIDPFGGDNESRNKVLASEGYSIEDWDFYENVWTVEMLDPDKMKQFSELYTLYSKKD